MGVSFGAVSYTHLDVYKRQGYAFSCRRFLLSHHLLFLAGGIVVAEQQQHQYHHNCLLYTSKINPVKLHIALYGTGQVPVDGLLLLGVLQFINPPGGGTGTLDVYKRQVKLDKRLKQNR